jgi:hypothetical protein
MITVTHENLKDILASVRGGYHTMYVPTAYRCTVIDRKAIERFEKAGYQVIRPDKDGKGFRMQTGKTSVYLFAGQLVAK